MNSFLIVSLSLLAFMSKFARSLPARLTPNTAVGNVRLQTSSCWLLPEQISLTARFGRLQTALAYARTWRSVDASEQVLGRMATRIAITLMGKHKPIYDQASSLLSLFLLVYRQLSGSSS